MVKLRKKLMLRKLNVRYGERSMKLELTEA